MEINILGREGMLEYASLLLNERRIPNKTVKYTMTVGY